MSKDSHFSGQQYYSILLPIRPIMSRYRLRCRKDGAGASSESLLMSVTELMILQHM